MSSPSVLDKRDRIAGLDRGLRLIEAFDETHPRLSPSTAARRTGMTRAAARRYLLTLQQLGYVESDGKLFSLTPRVLRLGWSYVDSANVARIAQPFLQRITSVLGGAAYFAVQDGDEGAGEFCVGRHRHAFLLAARRSRALAVRPGLPAFHSLYRDHGGWRARADRGGEKPRLRASGAAARPGHARHRGADPQPHIRSRRRDQREPADGKRTHECRHLARAAGIEGSRTLAACPSVIAAVLP